MFLPHIKVKKVINSSGQLEIVKVKSTQMNKDMLNSIFRIQDFSFDEMAKYRVLLDISVQFVLLP